MSMRCYFQDNCASHNLALLPEIHKAAGKLIVTAPSVPAPSYSSHMVKINSQPGSREATVDKYLILYLIYTEVFNPFK